MKLKTEIADMALWFGEEGEIAEGWHWVAQQDGDDRRWTRTITSVVRAPDGKNYAFDWEHGLTESQENKYPWENWNGPDLEEIDVYPVNPRTVTTTEWVRA